MIFVFDTETTGLPLRGVSKDDKDLVEKFSTCRIVEFAYRLYDLAGNELKSFRTLIKPENFEIKNSHIHGITNEIAINEGISIHELLKEIYTIFVDYSVSILVGHNVYFDINALLAECVRVGAFD